MRSYFETDERGIKAFILYWRNLKRIARLIRPYLKYIYFIAFLELLAVGANLYFPLLTQVNVDEAILKHNLSLFISISVLSVLILAINYVKKISTDLVSTCTDVDIQALTQARFFDKLVGAPYKRMKEYGEGELYVRYDSDLKAISGDMIYYIIGIATNLLTLVATLAITMMYSYKIVFLALPFIPMLFLETKLVANERSKLFTRDRSISESFYDYIKDRIGRLFFIKVLRREEQEKNAFREKVDAIYSLIMQKKYLELISGILKGHLLQIWTFVCTAYMGYMVVVSEITFGQMTAIMLYYSRLTLPLVGLFNVYPIIRIFNMECSRAFDILHEESEDEHEASKGLIYNPYGKLDSDIVVKDLAYIYDGIDEQIFENVNFEIPYGSKVAIVGENGAGKTTLANILTKLYGYTHGSVKFGEQELINIHHRNVRESIGYLTQEHMLFSCDNYADIFKKEDGLFEFRRSLDAMTDVRSISGGERQKLSLIQLIKNADYAYYIFDEFTNNFDQKSKASFLDYIMNELAPKTVIFITHDEMVLRSVNLIYLLHKNGMKAFVSYEEYMTSDYAAHRIEGDIA